MPIYSDQLGRAVEIPENPQRIVSLVPSQSEFLHSLGLEQEVLGITKFCVHPEHWYKNKKRIGGTKKLDIQAIKDLNPELIVANKEENSKEDIEALIAAGYPVWISDIYNFEDALDMMRRLGQIVGKQSESQKLIARIQAAKHQLAKNKQNCRVLYLIWDRPFMGVGSQTYIHDMLEGILGWSNVLATKKRYPELTIEEIRELHPERILLSSEPYPFAQKHLEDYSILFPKSRIELVDGEYFSWYGSRMLLAMDYFKALLKDSKAS